MKRILFALIIMICASTSVCAQNSSSSHRVMTECLKFRGVPMDQSVQDLAEVLVNKGYKYVEYEQWDQRCFKWPKGLFSRQITWGDSPNVTKVLSGSYAGYEDCRIVVSECTIKSNHAKYDHSLHDVQEIQEYSLNSMMVRVILPESDNIFALYQDFRDLDKKLSLKYKSLYSISEDNFENIKKEYEGRVFFCNTYDAEYGSVELSLQMLDKDEAIITITYFDNYCNYTKSYFEEEL